MKLPMFEDSNGQKSLTLTLLIITFVLAVSANILQMLGKVQNTSSTMEMLYSFVALYLGRRNLNFAGKSYDGGTASTIEQKVEGK